MANNVWSPEGLVIEEEITHDTKRPVTKGEPPDGARIFGMVNPEVKGQRDQHAGLFVICNLAHGSACSRRVAKFGAMVVCKDLEVRVPPERLRPRQPNVSIVRCGVRPP